MQLKWIFTLKLNIVFPGIITWCKHNVKCLKILHKARCYVRETYLCTFNLQHLKRILHDQIYLTRLNKFKKIWSQKSKIVFSIHVFQSQKNVTFRIIRHFETNICEIKWLTRSNTVVLGFSEILSFYNKETYSHKWNQRKSQKLHNVLGGKHKFNSKELSSVLQIS